MSRGWARTSVPGRKSAFAYRIAYERFVGPIPEGFQIDHICRNRACVNPAHLEAVSQHENMRRSGVWLSHHRRARRRQVAADGHEVCSRGHDMGDASPNTRWKTNRLGTRVKLCRACNNLLQRQKRQDRTRSQ